MAPNAPAGRRLGAAAILRDGAGRVLLVRHTYGHLNWELPGGFSEAEESAAATALREVREETGLTAEVGRLSGVYYEAEHDLHHFVFLCHALGAGVPRPSSPEVSECRYWDVAALPRPLSDFTLRRIDDALRAPGAAWTTIGPRRWVP